MLGGSAFNVWAMQKRPLEKARRAANWAGCLGDGPVPAFVSCLRSKPAELLARTTTIFKRNYGPISVWAPVLDRWSKEPFLSQYPIEALLRRQHYPVPLMASDTSKEGLFPTAGYMGDLDLAVLDLEWTDNAPFALDTVDTLGKSESSQVLSLVRQHYFARKSIYQNITLLIKLLSDRMYFADTSKGLALQASLNPRIHFYMFNYNGSQSSVDSFLGKNNLGTSHIDDFLYLMNTSYPEPRENSKSDVRMIERMTDMVYNYAKTGEAVFLPGCLWAPQKGPSNAFSYMRIDSPDSVVQVEEENFGDGAFWDSLPLQEPWAGRSNTPLS